MARKAQSTELDVARRVRTATREKMSKHIGSGNLSRSGREKPLVAHTPPERAKTASQLRNEYGNGREKSVKQIEREIVGNSITMQGKARAVTTAQRNVGNKVEALKLGTTLTVPMTRNNRASNKDGATSFHFKHEAIAKTGKEKTSASGTKTRRGAARDHAKYLERDSAVARNGEAVEGIGQDGEGKAAAAALGLAASEGVYIEREEALAHQENGVAVLYSNISQDAAERQRFWELVEEHESEPNPDRLRIVTGQAPEFWEAVRTDPRCPKQLVQAIEEADPAKPYRVKTDDNEYIREIMTDHGWAPPSPRRPDETDAEKAAREKFDQENSKGAACEDGRGGRIQNRIVGELPYEVTHEQRVRILRRFAAKFDEKKLPYVAVMHAPDHANNDKNWHFHLAYYERPCGRFTGEVDDHLGKLKPNANWHDEARFKAKSEALKTGELEQYVGQWDFAVPMARKSSSRHSIITYPFAQDKDRDCTKRDFPLELRKLLAGFTNDELEIAKAGRRVDPRRYTEMGINKEAEQHLGSRSAQMESLGIATPRGVENEHRQWQFTLDKIEKKFEADNRRVDNEERQWRQTLESRALNPDDNSEVSKMITRWVQSQSEANEQRAIATELAQHLERARSRAKKVEQTCDQHLEAIRKGQSNTRQKGNQNNYEQRLAEAQEHLAGLTIFMVSEIIQEDRSRKEADKLEEEAKALRKAIDDRLKDEMNAMMAAAPVMDKGEAKAKTTDVANDDGVVAANDDGKPEAAPILDRSQSDHSLKQFEIERFMKHLVDNNRRLERERGAGKYIVPVNPDEKEIHVITARNYADLQPRLRKLKESQDTHIDNLAQHILANPQSIKVMPGKAGAAASYELLSPDKTLQRTFKGFASDEQVAVGIEAALEARKKTPVAVEPSAPVKEAVRAPAPAQEPIVPAKDVVRVPAAAQETIAPKTISPTIIEPDEAKAPKPSPRAEVMKKIDTIAAAATPIIRETKDGKTSFKLSDEDMKAYGLVPADLKAPPVQTRLRGISREQDSDIKRLAGFVRRYPARTVTNAPTLFSNNEPTIELARNAPDVMRVLAQKYSRNPIAQQAMTDALATDKPDPIRERSEQKIIEPKITEPRTAKPRTAETKMEETRPLPIEPKPEKVTATKVETPAPRQAPVAPSEGIDMTQPINVTPEPREHKPRIEQPVEAKQERRIEERPAQERPVSDKLGEPKVDQTTPDKPTAPITPSARPAPGRPVMLTAEERAELMRPRKFGTTSGSQPIEVAAKVEQVIQGGAKSADIPRGAHPKIDAWINALDAQDREARQEAAFALKNDRRALKVAHEQLDETTQARIRMDWEAQQARTRDEQSREVDKTKSRTKNILR